MKVRTSGGSRFKNLFGNFGFYEIQITLQSHLGRNYVIPFYNFKKFLMLKGLHTLIFIMLKRAYLPSFTILIIALYLFEIFDMIFEFLPAMTKFTIHLVDAPIFISYYFFLSIPIGTTLSYLLMTEGSFVILPIMGVDASKSIVVDFAKRTKF